MNKHDVKDWKNSPVTKSIISSIHEAVEVTRHSSNMRDTVDQTAMQASYSEGFCDGVKSLLDSIEELGLELEMEADNDE